MTLRLVVVDGPSTGLHAGLDGRSAFTVGSSPMADLTVRDPALAAVHLRFVEDGAGYTCVDLSKRGFQWRGQRVGRASLQPGDAIGAGSHAFKLISDARLPGGQAAAPPPPPPPPAGAGARLVVLSGNDAGRGFDLASRPSHTIGRGQTASVLLWDIRASRNHCRLDHQDGSWLLSDLNASNGTYVNEARVKGTRLLRDGDQIRIGSSVLRFDA